MHIIVPIKQVPGTTDVKLNKKSGTLEREGVFSIINPEDKNALELALSLKEKNGAEVIIITMGPPQAEEALIEALAMGGDKAYLISDRKFAGADTWATAYTLSKAISKIGNYDMIICGRQAIDGDTAQVGPQLAGFLDLPQITYVIGLDIKGDKVIARREIEEGYMIVESQLPVLLTVTEKLNVPRYPRIDLIFDAYKENKITRMSTADIMVEEDKIGLDGSPTKVKRVFSPPRREKGLIIEGTPKEVSEKIIDNLRDKGII